MSNELFTIDGKRKYLNSEELDRFIMDNHAQNNRLEALNTEEVNWIEWARTKKLLPESP